MHRSFYTAYDSTITVRDIELYRFTAPKEVYLSGDIYPENKGFCVPPRCLPSGLLNISRCQPMRKLDLVSAWTQVCLVVFFFVWVPQEMWMTGGMHARTHWTLGWFLERERERERNRMRLPASLGHEFNVFFFCCCCCGFFKKSFKAFVFVWAHSHSAIGLN